MPLHHKLRRKPDIFSQDQFIPFDGNAHLLEITLKTFNIPHIRSMITSCLLGYEISRFVAALRLEWTRHEKAICTDIIRNVFDDALTARHWIRQGCTIVLLGQDVNAIMRRVRSPLMKLHASKDSDRIVVSSVFLRRMSTFETADVSTNVNENAMSKSADSMIHLRSIMVKPIIGSFGGVGFNAAKAGHLVITLPKGDFVRTVVISENSTFSHTVQLVKGTGSERSHGDKHAPAMLIRVQHVDGRGVPTRKLQYGHVPLLRPWRSSKSLPWEQQRA